MSNQEKRVAQPSGISGMLGSARRAHHMQATPVAYSGRSCKYNGSLSRGGQIISIKIGNGA
jgi:hypothetical protein